MYVIFKKCYIDMNVGYKEPEPTNVEIKNECWNTKQTRQI